MGIYDREYYRTEPAGSGLLGGAAPMCKRLIAVTIVVYVLQILTARGAGGGVTGWLGFDPDEFFGGFQLWRIVTYAFCHSIGDQWHIVFNMLGLWIFGNQVEAIYGSREFLWFYLASAVVAAVCNVLLGFAVGHVGAMVGASGAVMAVMMVCAMYYPRQTILVMWIIPMEFRWLVVLCIIGDLYPVLRDLGRIPFHDNVAHMAHLGGLLYGYLYKRFDLRFQHWLPAWRLPRFRRLVKSAQKRNPPVRLYRPPDEQDLDKRVDEILAKISAHGESSLTDSERETLKDASRRYKER